MPSTHAPLISVPSPPKIRENNLGIVIGWSVNMRVCNRVPVIDGGKKIALLAVCRSTIVSGRGTYQSRYPRVVLKASFSPGARVGVQYEN
jgi:hypothetical protein